MKKSSLLMFLLIAVLPALVSTPAATAPYLSSTVDLYYNIKGAGGHHPAHGVTNQGNAITLVEAGTFSSQSVTASYHANAWAKTTYGSNHAAANLVATNLLEAGTYVTAYSRWQDTWTINGPAGQSGWATVGVFLDGTYNDNGYFHYQFRCKTCDDWGSPHFGKAITVSSSDTAPPSYTDPLWNGTINQQFTGSFLFHYNTPMRIRSTLDVTASISGYGGSIYSGWGTVDFGNTAALTLLDLPDGATLTTASGTVYPREYTPQITGTIPEPSSLALFLGGMIGVLGISKRWTH